MGCSVVKVTNSDCNGAEPLVLSLEAEDDDRSCSASRLEEQAPPLGSAGGPKPKAAPAPTWLR